MFIGIDIGGSFIKVGVFNEKSKQVSALKLTTQANKGGEYVLAKLVNKLKEHLQSEHIDLKQIEGIGVCAPGEIDQDAGVLVYSNNLPFRNTSIKRVLEREFKCPVKVGHDVKTAALAEIKMGNLRNVKNAVYIALGTGMGAALIQNGELVESSDGFITEIGHTTFISGGAQCTCGRRGFVDACCSVKGILRDARTVGLIEGAKSATTAKDIFEMHAQNNKKATVVIKNFLNNVCEVILNLNALYVPDKIVIGGGLSYDISKNMDYIVNYLKKFDYGYYKNVYKKIETGNLFNDASMLGAILMVR